MTKMGNCNFFIMMGTPRQKKRGGQSTLEMTAGLIIFAMLLVGAARIFVWLNNRIVSRQEAYEATRVAAANEPQAHISDADIMDPNKTKGVQVNESAYPALNIFE